MSKRQFIISITLLAITLFCLTDGATLHAQTEDFDCTTVSEIPTTECETLIAIYEHSGGPDWHNNTDWLITETPCSWHGVACGNRHVIGLELPRNNVTHLAAEISDFTRLAWLNLNNNQLSTLPVEIMNLSALNKLMIHLNRLQIEDDGFADYLTMLDPMWANTQTVPPKSLTATAKSDTTLNLTWEPIAYSRGTGHYEISYATELDGPYTTHGTIADKTASVYELDGLSAATSYSIRICKIKNFGARIARRSRPRRWSSPR